jgi:hypothetical protein
LYCGSIIIIDKLGESNSSISGGYGGLGKKFVDGYVRFKVIDKQTNGNQPQESRKYQYQKPRKDFIQKGPPTGERLREVLLKRNAGEHILFTEALPRS